MTIPIGIFLGNSVVRDEPVVTTIQGIYVLILYILLFGGAYLISRIYGGIYSFFYIIGLVFFVFYINDKTTIFRIKKPSDINSRQMKSEISQDHAKQFFDEGVNFFENDRNNRSCCFFR